MEKMITRSEILARGRDWLVLTAAVMIGMWVVGVHAHLFSLLLISATISLFNAILRPLLLQLSLPCLMATFGAGLIFVLWFINALFLYIAWNLVEGSGLSFARAMLGALFVSGAQFFLNLVFGIRPAKIDLGGNAARDGNDIPPDPPPPPRNRPRSRRRENDDDVIDI